MRLWKDEESGCNMCEPDCADEWLHMLWAVGCDYDGCTSPKDLRELIDELVEMSQKARECLQDGKIFTNTSERNRFGNKNDEDFTEDLSVVLREEGEYV